MPKLTESEVRELAKNAANEKTPHAMQRIQVKYKLIRDSGFGKYTVSVPSEKTTSS